MKPRDEQVAIRRVGDPAACRRRPDRDDARAGRSARPSTVAVWCAPSQAPAKALAISGGAVTPGTWTRPRRSAAARAGIAPGSSVNDRTRLKGGVMTAAATTLVRPSHDGELGRCGHRPTGVDDQVRRDPEQQVVLGLAPLEEDPCGIEEGSGVGQSLDADGGVGHAAESTRRGPADRSPRRRVGLPAPGARPAGRAVPRRPG